ncbi:MAG: MerR family transcriptional regulator [Oscillospiraceae bacterium]|nr:MerR family transcriptional regulator [Oscillospiraceae bacterium]
MLTIGQFSKVCMVTVKALRHYDEIGLIKPVEINDETGYRQYSEEQIPRMLLINRLKYYGFSLSEIKDILSCDNTILIRLKRQKDVLINSIAETEAVIAELDKHIRDLERTGDIMSYQNNYDVELVTTEDRHIIACRQNMSVDDFGKYYGVLYKRVADENIVLNGVCMAIYHDKEFNPENSDIELALGVSDKALADKTIEGTLCASTVHIGGYSKLSEAYGALTKWIEENDYEITAPPYEIYVKTHFDKLPTEKWETRIFFPVRKA